MKGFCPSCEKESELTRVQKVENFTVKGEIIPVQVDYIACTECGKEFDNPDPAYDPLAAAYQEFRRRKGMVQPQDIHAFREKYGLTQRELSELLGFGGATLSRYENGALQNDSHNNLLRLVMEPQNLLDMIQHHSDEFEPGKRENLSRRLRSEINLSELLGILKSREHYRAPNLFNGLRVIDPIRLLNAIKILCYQTNVYKTKLNKLLFYVDFKYFKEHGMSITGLCYAHLPLGPVPDQFQSIFQRLTELDARLIHEDDPSPDCTGEYFRCDAEPPQSVFSFDELQVLIQVKNHFRTVNATTMVNISHEEAAYQQTKMGELIPYSFAVQLRI